MMNVVIDIDFRNYAEVKTSYTQEELLDIIHRIKRDIDTTRNKLKVA
ncbi:MAG: hypothetical protein HDT28_07575 [Clostridiales bacterium]|nr:hypothetical protein [Clostridiales bacterium]